MKKKSLIYITRKASPSIGGMQRFNDMLIKYLSEHMSFYLLKWGRSQVFLPFFIVFAFFGALSICTFRPAVKLIYLSDAALSFLVAPLKFLTRKKIVVSVHGRDLVYPLNIYQSVLIFSLLRADKIICVSDALKKKCIERGVPECKLTVIPNGVNCGIFDIDKVVARDHLESKLGIELSHRKILLTVGRLVPKKGVYYFVREILPQVIQKQPNVFYCIVGDGPQKQALEELIVKIGLQQHVYMVGHIDMTDKLLVNYYRGADLFVMPNIPVDDDMEGFGIVGIEAGAAELPVIAFNTDGVGQAIKHLENGFLIDFPDRSNFGETIYALLNDDALAKKKGQEAREYNFKYFSWSKIAEEYANEFSSTVASNWS